MGSFREEKMDVFLFKHLLLLLRVFSSILVQRDTRSCHYIRKARRFLVPVVLIAVEEYLDALHSRKSNHQCLSIQNNERDGKWVYSTCVPFLLAQSTCRVINLSFLIRSHVLDISFRLKRKEAEDSEFRLVLDALVWSPSSCLVI